jgi:hypothetical protein
MLSTTEQYKGGNRDGTVSSYSHLLGVRGGGAEQQDQRPPGCLGDLAIQAFVYEKKERPRIVQVLYDFALVIPMIREVWVPLEARSSNRTG